MGMLKVVSYKKPADLLSEFVRVKLRNGGLFNFRIIETTAQSINGFDDEGINLVIDFEDIDYIVGG